MSRRPRFASLLALSLVVAVSGCSFRIVRPAPPREEWPAPRSGNTSQVPCTASPAPPIIDLTFAAGLGTLGFVERNSGTPKVALGLSVLAIPLLVSAIYGAYRVTGCRSYQAAISDAQTGP